MYLTSRVVALLGLFAVLALAAVVRADTVFNQPPSPAGGLIASSWVDPNGSDSDMYAWDNFTLPASQSIGEVRWRGGYVYNAMYGAVVDFTISIYGSNATGFEPQITQPPLVQYQVGGNAGETVAGVFGGVTMYDYAFVLPTAFPAAAGVKYWLLIEGAQTTYPDWGITVGTGGNGSHFHYSTGAHRYYFLSGDTNFTLLTVAPGTFSISGNVGLEFGGAPVGGVTVQTGNVSATTAASGNYTLTGLPAGTHLVSCSKPGYTFSAPQEIDLGPSATGVDFTANPAATISGRVTQGGAGFPGATVFAGGNFAVSGADGTYVIERLTPGQYYTSCLPLAGYTFSPEYILAIAQPDATDVDFVAAPAGNPAPTVTSLSPTSAPVGTAGLSLTVHGAGFLASSVVRWNGADRATQFVSAAELTADIPAADLSSQGTAQITVFNPAPGGGASTPLAFVIGGFGISGRVTSNGIGQSGATVRATVNPPVSAAGAAPFAIPDNNTTGVDSTLQILDPGTVNSVQVEARIAHGRIGDLEVSVVHPDGTAVLLHNRTGGRAKNLCAGYPNPTAPAQSLTTLAGKSTAGVWKLRVRDRARGTAGILLGWSLSIARAGTAPLVTTTAADGAFAFLDLSAGTYAVTAEKPGRLPTPGVRTVTIGPNAVNVDFHLAAPVTLAGLKLTPAAVRGGRNLTARLTLTAPAPEDGAVIQLFSSDPTVVPISGTVIVPAGAKAAAVVVATGTVTRTLKVTLMACYAQQSRTSVVTVKR